MKATRTILEHKAQIVTNWTIEDRRLFVSEIFFVIHSRICSFVSISSGQEISLVEAYMQRVEGIEMAGIKVELDTGLGFLAPRIG